jgi:hypothetical protein
MRWPKLEELSIVIALLLAAAAFLFSGVLPGVICLFAAGCAAAVLWTPLRGYLGLSPSKGASVLPLVDRLKPVLSEGLAIMQQLDPTVPSLNVLQTARAWQKATYNMLAAERQDLAERFLDAGEPIEERETKSLTTVNSARLIMEVQTTVLKEIIGQLEPEQ